MLTIRRGLEEDLAAIGAIQSASPEAAQWKVADYLAYVLWVAAVGDEVAGFLVARQLGPGEGELLNVAVGPEFRRSGVGTALVQTLLAEFPNAVFLEVRASNAAALTLYNALGFQEVSRRAQYYDFPPEPAIVMKFHSC